MHTLVPRLGAVAVAAASLIVLGATAVGGTAQAATVAPLPAATSGAATAPAPQFVSFMSGPTFAAIGKGVPGAVVTLRYETRFGAATTSTTVDAKGYWWADLQAGFTLAQSGTVTLVQTVDGVDSAPVTAVG